MLNIHAFHGFHRPYGERAIREMSHVEDYSLLMRIGRARILS